MYGVTNVTYLTNGVAIIEPDNTNELTSINIRGLPREIKRMFNAECAQREVTQGVLFEEMLNGYFSEVNEVGG